MYHLKTFLLSFFTCFFTNAHAQLSTNEQPISFNTRLSMMVKSKSAVPVATMPQLDMARIEQEDKEDEEYDMPPRFGYQHKVNYNLDNSGVWYELSNGDKLWQLNVVCPSALSVNFCYNKFWIPKGGKLFVYSKDRKHSIGAFTSRNNKGDRENVRGFATGLVFGNDVVLEYYQPKEVTKNAIINIEYIVHGYRYINIEKAGFGQSGGCMVNINCEEGQNWQNEKKAVAMILVYGNRWCTGSLINTTNLSQAPFFLTANHCISDYGDAEENSYLDYYSFYWNYETPGCANVGLEPTYYSTSGATILANYSYSDFALLRLSEDPQELSNYTPFYLGWDRSGQSGAAGVCIHHPKGDVKKISTIASQPISASYLSYTESTDANHWKVVWGSTQNGHSTTEGGSSGSPLFTAEHKVIGQLHGGYADCVDNIDEPDWYGKFNVSWNGNNSNSIFRRLDCWLDSINAGVQTMEGLLIISTTQTIATDQQLYSNIRITSTGQLTVQSDVSMIGNCSIIVETGGKLIIDGGSISNVDILLKSGASLQIVNDGVIEIRNGLEAAQGAMVDITRGSIN